VFLFQRRNKLKTNTIFNISNLTATQIDFFLFRNLSWLLSTQRDVAAPSLRIINPKISRRSRGLCLIFLRRRRIWSSDRRALSIFLGAFFLFCKFCIFFYHNIFWYWYEWLFHRICSFSRNLVEIHVLFLSIFLYCVCLNLSLIRKITLVSKKK